MVDIEDLLADAQYDAYIAELEKDEEKKSITNAIHERFDKLEDMLRKSDVMIKEVFTIVKELGEEYRIDHPLMDKLAKMADEWGIDDFSQDNNK